MTLFVSLMIGVIFGIGIFMVTSESLLRVVLGVSILGQAANLLVFSSGHLKTGDVAFIDSGYQPALSTDPIPQAMVLTAIVIGFAITAFSVVLARQIFLKLNTDHLDDLASEEDA